MKRITILYIIDTFFEMAGAERNLYEVITHLNPNRYRPIVVCLQGGELVNSVKEKGIEIFNLRSKRIYTPLGIIKAIGLIRIIKQRNVKIVVTYHESSDFLGSIIAKLARVPVVISSRRDMGYKLKKRHILIYKLINPLFNRIITVSDAVKNIIFDRQDVLWHRLATIHNGVDLDNFSKEFDKATFKKSLGLDSNPVVGILAAIRPIKGHKYFLEAASIILKTFPKTNFLIVGWHYDGTYYNEIKELTKQLDIEKNVIFAGGREDTAEILSIMDISVFSSINEGFSNALLESMSVGKPVVATNSGGTPEAVVDGVTGILVPPCNANALSDAILKPLQDKKLAEEMGKAGRKRVEELFSLDRMIKEIENLYTDLLEEKTHKNKLSLKIHTETIISFFLRVVKLSMGISLYYSGLFTLIKKIILNKRGIKILAYHRIDDDNFDPLGMNIGLENFERQMRFIKTNYKLISLKEAIELLQTNKKILDDMVVVTFDDGYKSNYTNAYSILKKYNIPATVFLSVEAIDKKQMLWFEVIIEAFKKTNKNQIDLSELNMKKYVFKSDYEKMRAAKEIVSFSKTISLEKRKALIECLLKKLDIKFKDINNYNSMLDWKDIIEMKENNIDFGCHGLTHSILTKLSKEDLEYEIKESKRIIQVNTRVDIEFFAYPNGGIGDLNDDTEYMLKKYNYSAACTLIRGSNNGASNLYMLKRFCVTAGMGSGIFKHFSKSLFTLEMFGLFRIYKIFQREDNYDKMHEMYNA